MISNKRSSSGGPFPHGGAGDKPGSTEETLKTERIQIERKTFVFALKENPRGRFLRITEDVGGRRDTIIIPAPGLEEFRRVLDEFIKASPSPPPSNYPPLE
jgi:PurA ssDNA and RNA-binding protein